MTQEIKVVAGNFFLSRQEPKQNRAKNDEGSHGCRKTFLPALFPLVCKFSSVSSNLYVNIGTLFH